MEESHALLAYTAALRAQQAPPPAVNLTVHPTAAMTPPPPTPPADAALAPLVRLLAFAPGAGAVPAVGGGGQASGFARRGRSSNWDAGKRARHQPSRPLRLVP